MFTIQGKYSSAKIMTDNCDSETLAQLYNLCNQLFTAGCEIVIMPDCHAGKGCVIGFTAKEAGKIVPNLVGVDIGCGMYLVELGKIEIDFVELDKFIRSNIPHGFSIHENPIDEHSYDSFYCYSGLKEQDRFDRSLGTLGGGNHFIEVDVDDEGYKYLVIHSGSRNLGKQVCEFYQHYAIDHCKNLKIPKELSYLEGEYRLMYLNDMLETQIWAEINREWMATLILSQLRTEGFGEFHTTHNYIQDGYIRKGAVSAYKGQRLLIPMNMRDGSLLCTGKGNPDWNYSAPHGAGRIMSRGKAKKEFSVPEFEKTMQGIFTTSVSAATIDESPFAYKPMDEIISCIGSTVKIDKILKPVYNFKAA